MEITHYVPNKAVIHTIRVYGGFLDYMLFEVNQFGNLELYDHLMSEQVVSDIYLGKLSEWMLFAAFKKNHFNQGKGKHALRMHLSNSKHCKDDRISILSCMAIGKKTMEGVQNDRHNSGGTLTPVIQQEATTDEMYDDFMAELCNDNDILPLADDTFRSLFQLDEPFPLDHFSLEVLEKGESGQVPIDIPAHNNVTKDTTSIIQVTPYSSERVNISISPRIVVSNPSTFIREGPPKELAQEQEANMGVANSSLISRNCPNSSLSLPQNNPNLWVAGPNAWNHPSVMNSTAVGLGTNDPQVPQRVDASFGNTIFPYITGNSITQFQSPSFPVLPYGSSSNIYQQFQRSLPLQMIGNNARGTSAMVHRFNHGLFWPRPPSLRDFDSFVRAWKVN
ncbi:unnamed protein product [Sphenostylis stenocarpa]|uniref:Uncharacterized protein n=1 Tax=Sphenostylis stenocarpa TaxID=92480 RepID=A0AA86S8U5_9FABA|nr:unnamed protein product [Sphenostylis stenocarpa]